MMLFSSLTYTETDEQLMERFVSKKSEKAFEELYRRYAPRLKGFFIRMMSGDVALADDFLQELFLRIYEARSSYQAGKYFLQLLIKDSTVMHALKLRRNTVILF